MTFFIWYDLVTLIYDPWPSNYIQSVRYIKDYQHEKFIDIGWEITEKSRDAGELERKIRQKKKQNRNWKVFYMEKFLPLYSWDLNHVIQSYAFSLHGHVTTIQMQSIDFTPKTKNMNYSWQSGYPETVMDHGLVQNVHILWNFNLWK